MYQTLHIVHSYVAYVALTILILAVVNAISGWLGNRMFTLEKDFRLSLFALILGHVMLLIGLVLFFVSPNGLSAIQELGMGGLSSEARKLAVEHPFTNIIALVLITIGWSRHKKLMEGKHKFRTIAIFYGLGLILLLSMIPWGQWF